MESLQITTRTGEQTTLETQKIEAFGSSLRGKLLLQGDEGYDLARAIWNGMIDKRPALIARCMGTADVIRAVDFARANDLLVSIRGGGHNVAGNALCDGGLAIDLSQMKGIHVDPAARTVRAQPGANWGDMDRETQIFGLAAPGGIVSTTGISGLTLGGGFGWLNRKYGLTVDNLISADVVTANGQLLTASETENLDLFWGLRGGGGNFGVVASYEYRLHPVGPTVIAGVVVHRLSDAPEAMRFFRDFAAKAPDEITCMAFLRMAPKSPWLPQAFHGTPVVGLTVCYRGDPEEGERIVRPLKEFGKPVADTIGRKPFMAHQTFLDAGQPSGWQYYWKSEYLPGLSDDAIDTAISYAERITSPLSVILIFQLGGATGRVPEDAMAAGNRDAEFVININTAWALPSPQENSRHMQWTRDFWTAMRPFSTGHVYVNFISADEGEDRVLAAYGAEKYKRLSELKAKYDPDNLFHLNQNIKPRTAALSE